jgi:hypothetical protein
MTEIEIKPDCRKALTKLYEYIDGEITAADREKVRAHLETSTSARGLPNRKRGKSLRPVCWRASRRRVGSCRAVPAA